MECHAQVRAWKLMVRLVRCASPPTQGSVCDIRNRLSTCRHDITWFVTHALQTFPSNPASAEAECADIRQPSTLHYMSRLLHPLSSGCRHAVQMPIPSSKLRAG